MRVYFALWHFLVLFLSIFFLFFFVALMVLSASLHDVRVAKRVTFPTSPAAIYSKTVTLIPLEEEATWAKWLPALFTPWKIFEQWLHLSNPTWLKKKGRKRFCRLWNFTAHFRMIERKGPFWFLFCFFFSNPWFLWSFWECWGKEKQWHPKKQKKQIPDGEQKTHRKTCFEWHNCFLPFCFFSISKNRKSILFGIWRSTSCDSPILSTLRHIMCHMKPNAFPGAAKNKRRLPFVSRPISSFRSIWPQPSFATPMLRFTT